MLMTHRFMWVALAVGLLAAPGVRAQSADAETAVCLSIDEAHDTLSPQERSAALLMLGKQFEVNGRRVVATSCPKSYTVSHIRLGETIVVTLMGAGDYREGTALGLDDLPALYSQMVRSIVTGRPMSGFNVVDRGNVTAAQAAPPKRIQADSFCYARLGYGGVFGDRAYDTPSLGFGYRAELDPFALDVSFLNFQFPSAGAYGSAYGSSASSGSILKLQGLHFVNAQSNATVYFGGGMSYGFVDFGRSSGSASVFESSWHGSGLQGELTAGWELLRASAMRVFIETNATVPFYAVTSDRTTFARTAPYGTTVVSSQRYAPSVVVSLGLGWQRHGRP